MNTLRQNMLLLTQHRVREDREWEKIRYLGFTNYQTSMNTFKQIRKPSDLFKLESDVKRLVPIKIDKERSADAVSRLKELDTFKEWQHQT